MSATIGQLSDDGTRVFDGMEWVPVPPDPPPPAPPVVQDGDVCPRCGSLLGGNGYCSSCQYDAAFVAAQAAGTEPSTAPTDTTQT